MTKGPEAMTLRLSRTGQINCEGGIGGCSLSDDTEGIGEACGTGSLPDARGPVVGGGNGSNGGPISLQALLLGQLICKAQKGQNWSVGI